MVCTEMCKCDGDSDVYICGNTESYVFQESEDSDEDETDDETGSGARRQHKIVESSMNELMKSFWKKIVQLIMLLTFYHEIMWIFEIELHVHCVIVHQVDHLYKLLLFFNVT